MRFFFLFFRTILTMECDALPLPPSWTIAEEGCQNEKKKNFLRFYFDDFLLSVHLITHFNDITIYIWHYSPVYLAKINVGEMTARECFICRRSKTWISLYKLILFILLFSLSLFKHFSFFSTVSSTPPESWFWFLFFTFFYCILYSFIFSPIFLTIFIIKLS